MRKLTASVMLLMAACATAQTNAPIDNFALVTNLWWNGYKTNVLQIAEQRLAINSNDIVGLILKLEYDVEFINLQLISNSVFSVAQCGRTISTPLFSQRLSQREEDLEEILDLVAIYPMEEYESDKAKAFLPGKRMLFEEDLLAACLDGLATNLPPAQQ